MKKQMSTWMVVSALAIAAPAFAQTAPAAVPMNMGDMRHHIYVMEGALARAVDYGAKILNREILAVMPGVFMLEGEAQARGVFLDGYGVFFDVRVPMMRQSMMWSLRMMLDQDEQQTQLAISDIRKNLQGVTDPTTRASLEKLLRQLERQAPGGPQPRSASDPAVGAATVVSGAPSAGTPMGAAAATGIASPRAATAPRDSVWVKDPNRAYTEAVTNALVDAMIDYSAPMKIAAEQWLTVAARDNEGRDSLAPQDPLEEVVTMIYRIKGSDLIEYRTGRIDRDEVRRRVQTTQF